MLHFESPDAIEKHPLEIVKDKGGIDSKNQDHAGFFKVLTAFGKKIAAKVLKGKFNFSSMQRPTLLSLNVSHLQVLSYEFVLMAEYFLLAKDIQNDVDRLKMIVSGIIGNMSYNIFQAKGKGPVNPTLGETYSVHSLGKISKWNFNLLGTGINDSFHNVYICCSSRSIICVFMLCAGFFISLKFS